MRKERRRQSGDRKVPLHPGEKKGKSNVTEIDGLEKGRDDQLHPGIEKEHRDVTGAAKLQVHCAR